MPSGQQERRDLRAYARETQRGLILGALLLIFLVGDGLIWWIYGPTAGRFALLCTALGLAPVAAIVIWLKLVEWLARRAANE